LNETVKKQYEHNTHHFSLSRFYVCAFDCAAHVISEMNRGRFKSTPIFADKMTIQLSCDPLSAW